MKKPSAIILMVTLGCHSECVHCCFACEPSKIEIAIPEDDMLRYIEDAKREGISSVVFSGGEPMLYLENLIRPIRLAYKFGMYVDIRTNAYWADDYKATYDTLKYLKSLGLQRVGLSYDKFHAETIPQSNIINALNVSTELGLSPFLDWIGKESWDEVVGILKISSPVLRYVGTPLRAGRAVNLDESYFCQIPIEVLESDCRYSAHCGEKAIPLLTIFPSGYASCHPCCWVNPSLIRKINGNGWIRQIREDMANSLMVNSFAKTGLGGLIKSGREIYSQRLQSYYAHQCEVCYDLLGEVYKDEVEELPQYIKDFRGVE